MWIIEGLIIEFLLYWTLITVSDCDFFSQAENTFILALDGDIEFKPDAVKLLIDRLKVSLKTGAVCGRIHPVGTGEALLC